MDPLVRASDGGYDPEAWQGVRAGGRGENDLEDSGGGAFYQRHQDARERRERERDDEALPAPGAEAPPSPLEEALTRIATTDDDPEHAERADHVRRLRGQLAYRDETTTVYRRSGTAGDGAA